MGNTHVYVCVQLRTVWGSHFRFHVVNCGVKDARQPKVDNLRTHASVQRVGYFFKLELQFCVGVFVCVCVCTYHQLGVLGVIAKQEILGFEVSIHTHSHMFPHMYMLNFTYVQIRR